MSKPRKKRCAHVGQEMTAAYTMTGVGRWRSIVWCAKCGALGFRDYAGGVDGTCTEEWRSPKRARK